MDNNFIEIIYFSAIVRHKNVETVNRHKTYIQAIESLEDACQGIALLTNFYKIKNINFLIISTYLKTRERFENKYYIIFHHKVYQAQIYFLNPVQTLFYRIHDNLLNILLQSK